MVDDLTNPGVTPSPGTPEYGRDKPRLGEGEEAQEPKPFSLEPQKGKEVEGTNISPDRPSPMDVAREGARQQPQMTPEQLSNQLEHLKGQLNETQTKLQDPNVTNKFTTDHDEALNRLVDKMNPDMRTIARNSQGEFNPPQKLSGEKIVNYVTRWIDGSQGTLSNALNYLSTTKKPEITSFLKLQFAVQRASQRGELFASIVGSSVSGIKTIMSTQLG